MLEYLQLRKMLQRLIDCSTALELLYSGMVIIKVMWVDTRDGELNTSGATGNGNLRPSFGTVRTPYPGPHVLNFLCLCLCPVGT